MKKTDRGALAVAVLLANGLVCLAQPSFFNWENPHVHPLELTPDGTRLLAVNTPDGRLEIFEIGSGMPVAVRSIPVGIDPVSVRARTDQEAWVVNLISDSVSIVDLNSGSVRATLRTGDEPCDVVFAGTPTRAYVSCSQENTVMVFDPNDPAATPISLAIAGEEPRALAVKGDGSEVYVAIFESGNQTTILGGGRVSDLQFPPNVVNHILSPYFDPGQPRVLGINPPNPPPNLGTQFYPPIQTGLPTPPRVGMIVRKNGAGQWYDDNNHEWTHLVSGADANRSGRPVGWDLVDHDLAVIDTATLKIRYASGLMNLCMALAVNPAHGGVAVLGTDAINEVRFEPVLRGRFLRVNLGMVDPAGPSAQAISDLNPHLTYTSAIPFVPLPQAERNRSVGDPRGVVWNSSGTVGYVSGMGSNNVVLVDSLGSRMPQFDPIVVGEGPTGMALDESHFRLYVLNKFESSISVVDTLKRAELTRIPLFDPSPPAIKIGRKHLYDTHRTSGLGHLSCASCHVDSRWDRLAWDLGDPSGSMRTFNQICSAGLCEDWHPMKGPMATQTLQDIIGKEPHHWRADRNGLEEFADAFEFLLGDDEPLPPAEMQEFEDFLATIHFPPNPHRNFDNSLPVNLPLPGQFAVGRFGPAGTPLSNGDAVRGLLRFRTGGLDGSECVTCHSLPTGLGPDGYFIGNVFQPVAPGPEGERHHASVAIDGSTNTTIKIPQLRNMFEKTGFDMTQTLNLSGFGFLHDGSVDSLARFISPFGVTSDQDVADLVAFMMAFSGSDLPQGSPNTPLEPPGGTSLDTHSAVGRQTTLASEAAADPGQLALISNMLALADTGRVGVVVKGLQDTIFRGYRYDGAGVFQSDRAGRTISAATLQSSAATGSELTYTVVPKGTATRIGIDRDEDGYLDRDEIDACSDPADSASVPPQCSTTPGACCDLGGVVGCIDGVPQGTCEETGGSFQGPGSTCFELCDGEDNDCDGDVDEGFDLGSACAVGLGECHRNGFLVCSPDGSSAQCDVAPGAPSTELCDALDNNCNGSTDEPFTNLGTGCSVGIGACAATGTWVCSANGLATQCDATPGTPSTEACADGLDNDCDGLTDAADTDCGGCGACRLHGDVAPIGPPTGDCQVELADVLCILDGYTNEDSCSTGDIEPCGGNGLIELGDLLSVLDAYSNLFDCPHPCPP